MKLEPKVRTETATNKITKIKRTKTQMKKVNKLKSEDCKYFHYCDASLCPLDEKHLKIGSWYPDGKICRLKKVPLWVRNQKKIAKKYKNANRYFTHRMLKQNCIIRSGIEGLDPNKNKEPQLRAWLKKHPQKPLRIRKTKKATNKAKK